jgi:hypothetical protein
MSLDNKLLYNFLFMKRPPVFDISLAFDLLNGGILLYTLFFLIKSVNDWSNFMSLIILTN